MKSGGTLEAAVLWWRVEEEAESVLIGWPPLPPTNPGPEVATEEVSSTAVLGDFEEIFPF